MCSTGGHTAVHDHARPDAGGRLVRGEVGGHRGYFLWGDKPIVRLASLHVGAGLVRVGVAGCYTGDPGRVHGSRDYAVDPHALLDVVYGRRPREREDRALRRAVDGAVRDPHEGSHRGHVDYRPSPRVLYDRDGVLHPEEGSPYADVHHPLVVFLCGVHGGRRHPHPRVVHHNVEAAPRLDRARDQRSDLVRSGDVRSSYQRLAVYLRGDLLRRLLVYVGDGDSGAFAREPEGDGAPDPGSSTRNYGPLALETVHRTPCFLDPGMGQYNDARIWGANVGRGACMEPFPDWMKDSVPEVDARFTGLEGRLLASPHGQAVFFSAAEAFEVPPHAHGAQWGIVVTGRLHLTVSGEAGTYEPGDTYDVPAGAEHSARLEAGTCVIDVFQEPDRYRAK